MNEETEAVAQYPIPFTPPLLPNSSLPIIPDTDRPVISCGLEAGADGLLYASNGARNRVVVINLTTEVIEVSTLGNAYPLDDLSPALQAGYYTQSTGNVITRFDYQTRAFKSFEIPTKLSLPIGVYYASDRGVWFLEFVASKLGRFDSITREIVEFDLRAELAGPTAMRAETEGRYLWFTGFLGGLIGRVDIVTRKIIAYPIPNSAGFPVEVCADSQGDTRFTHLIMNALGRFRPSTGKFLEVVEPGPLPAPISSLVTFVGDGIFCKPRDNIWFSHTTANRIGKYKL